MAEVFGPALSIAATGDLGGSLNFSCGKTVRKKRTEAPKQTPALKVVNDNFKAAANDWPAYSDELVGEWRDFWKWHIKKSKCDIVTEIPLNGYKAFMKYYLKLGSSGWPNYPHPPEISPKYPKSYFPWEVSE